jgi:hypothetical protein
VKLFVAWLLLETKLLLDPKSLFSVGIAVLTVFLSLSTWLLWRQIRALWQSLLQETQDIQEALKIAHSAAGMSGTVLVQSQRAFVYLSEWVTILARENTGAAVSFNIRPRWENVGVTAAKRVDARATFVNGDPRQDIDTIVPDYGLRRDQLILAPMTALSGVRFSIPITDLAEAWEGRLKIIVFARIEYNDVFEGTKRHTTEQCAEMILVRDPRTIPREGAQVAPFVTYRICGRRNTTD